MKYWEKTVEYAFLTDAIKERKANFAAPLSGKLERGAGDAVFANDSLYVLIEFKVDESGKSAEKIKFDNYEEAKAALHDKDSHHFFVYGQPASGGIKLVSKTYFSDRDPPGGKNAALDCFGAAVSKNEFDSYLSEFLSYRQADGRGGGGVDVSDYAVVIGVAPDNVSATVSSLRDYASHCELGQVSSLVSEPSYPVTPKGP